MFLGTLNDLAQSSDPAVLIALMLETQRRIQDLTGQTLRIVADSAIDNQPIESSPLDKQRPVLQKTVDDTTLPQMSPRRIRRSKTKTPPPLPSHIVHTQALATPPLMQAYHHTDDLTQTPSSPKGKALRSSIMEDCLEEFLESYDYTDDSGVHRDVDEEKERITLKGLKNKDYNLNSPLISDELDAFVIYLNKGINNKRFGKPIWCSWREKIRNLNASTFLGSSDSHKEIAKIFLNQSVKNDNAKEIIGYINLASTTVEEVQRSFFRSWLGKEIPHTTKEYDDTTLRWLQGYWESLNIVRFMNASTDEERGRIVSLMGGTHDGMICQFEGSFFESVLLMDDWAILKNGTVLSRNLVLMIKDTLVARFATLASLIDKMDNNYEKENISTMHMFYNLGDQLIKEEGNAGYTGLKMVESMCIEKMAQISASYRPLIPPFTKFGEHVSGVVKERKSSYLSSIYDLIISQTRCEIVLTMYGSFRHWGHPFIDYLKGLQKLHTQVTMIKEIDKEYAEKLASDLAYIVLKDQFDEKKNIGL